MQGTCETGNGCDTPGGLCDCGPQGNADCCGEEDVESKMIGA